MEGSGFLYYSPDPQGLQQKQHGHHGHFLPYVAPSPQLLAPTPIHFPSQLVLGGRGIPLSITPFASPSLMEAYASQECFADSASSEIYINPATPPLTHSGLSTPSLPYAMATPISNHGWSSYDEPAITTVAPYEVQLPCTPMEYMPGLLVPTVVKSSASPAPSITLNDIHCPALSPCSSQASFSSEPDFCDPRNLTVQSPTPIDCNPSVIFPPMSVEIVEQHDQFIFGQELEQFLPLASVASKPYITGDYNDELSDLECSEDEFIHSFEESVFTPSPKRMKYESDSENEQLPSPPMSKDSSRDSSPAPSKPSKQRKIIKKRKESPCSEASDMSEEERLRSFKFGGCGDDCDDEDHDHDSESSYERSAGIPINPHVIRRGRKQSLTEDPSKTFVCHLCNRRFRRQEHLKRHFRSLHTEDKPFSCDECGKRFSRSDNLTQHSRIHGTGSVVLGVLTEDEVSNGPSDYHPVEDNASLPMIKQELNSSLEDDSTITTETKDQTSSEDKKARRKRKRSEE